MKRKAEILAVAVLLFIGLNCQNAKNPVQPSVDDADEIVYATFLGEIYRTNINNRTRQQIPITGTNPIVSPNGRHLAFYSSKTENVKSIITMNLSNLNGIHEKQLATVAEGDSVFIIYTAAWSPDSKKIVYAAPKEDRVHNIYLFDLEENQEIRLSVDGGVDPRFSPDGRLVTYDTFAPNDIGKSYIVNSDGTSHHAFMPNEPVLQPRWSRDMRKIYYTFYRSPGPDLDADIFVVDADGTNPRQLTFDGKSVIMALSPDGKSLLYRSVSDLYSSNDYYILNLESKITTKITTGLIPARAYWSPNGNMLAFVAAVPGNSPTFWLWRTYNNSLENLGIPSDGGLSWIPKVGN